VGAAIDEIACLPTAIEGSLGRGDLVRVKPQQEILATLDAASSNRGLSFEAELVPHCGKTYRAKTRVEKFIDENTGAIVASGRFALAALFVLARDLAGKRYQSPTAGEEATRHRKDAA
jgi:hypothetical protein